MKLKNFSKSYARLTLAPGAGADVYECKREAATIALREGITVEFNHNNRLHVISLDDILSAFNVTNVTRS